MRPNFDSNCFWLKLWILEKREILTVLQLSLYVGMNLMTASRCVSTIEKFIELTNQKGPLMIKLFVRVSRFQAGFRLTGSRPKIKMLFLNWLSHMVIDFRSRSCRTREHYQIVRLPSSCKKFNL